LEGVERRRRLNIDDGLPDALRDLIHSDAVDGIGSQYFDFAAKEFLELANESREDCGSGETVGSVRRGVEPGRNRTVNPQI